MSALEARDQWCPWDPSPHGSSKGPGIPWHSPHTPATPASPATPYISLTQPHSSAQLPCAPTPPTPPRHLDPAETPTVAHFPILFNNAQSHLASLALQCRTGLSIARRLCPDASASARLPEQQGVESAPSLPLLPIRGTTAARRWPVRVHGHDCPCLAAILLRPAQPREFLHPSMLTTPSHCRRVPARILWHDHQVPPAAAEPSLLKQLTRLRPSVMITLGNVHTTRS